MKKLLLILMVFLSLPTFPQTKNYSDLPVTTLSAQALQYYNKGIQEMVEVQRLESNNNLTRALELDPSFMMPHVIMAIRAFNDQDPEMLKKQAAMASASTASLTDSEKLIQQAMKKLAADPQADVTAYGKELVAKNPDSYLASLLLASFQQMARDNKGALATYQNMLTLPDHPASVFNSLGYLYMADNQMEKARSAFENYMREDPENANVYDSMGDYCAQLNDYPQAYDYYMKAYEMDPFNFNTSQDKATRIKPQVAEQK